MFMRVDKLQAELPAPKRADPNAAAALQELLGGKYGEMSTLNNYMFQSFNFRSKSKLKPFYSFVASITAEELGHVELVSNGVAMIANGPGIWGNGEVALPDDPKGELEVVDGLPEGGKIHDLTGVASAFTPTMRPKKCSRSRRNYTKLRADLRTSDCFKTRE